MGLPKHAHPNLQPQFPLPKVFLNPDFARIKLFNELNTGIKSKPQVF